MYSDNFSIPQETMVMYQNNRPRPIEQNHFGSGFFVPFLLGGIGGYALGNNNQPNYYPYPYPYPQPYPVPYPYPNNYYYPY